MKSLLRAVMAACAFTCAIGFAQVYKLPQVPANFPYPMRHHFLDTRSMLTSELSNLRSRATLFNVQCASVATDSPVYARCSIEYRRLEKLRSTFNEGAKRYGEQLAQAARETGADVVATSVHGHVELSRDHDQAPLRSHALLRLHDCITTSAASSALIAFRKGTFDLGANAQFCYLPRTGESRGFVGYLSYVHDGRQIKMPVIILGTRG